MYIGKYIQYVFNLTYTDLIISYSQALKILDIFEDMKTCEIIIYNRKLLQSCSSFNKIQKCSKTTKIKIN